MIYCNHLIRKSIYSYTHYDVYNGRSSRTARMAPAKEAENRATGPFQQQVG
ncbi:MAG: hypothetical protein QG666_578, partial [Euryarchaeota archaeon]|nr:hypothetical protein [Euryarchaeota archaeon]